MQQSEHDGFDCYFSELPEHRVPRTELYPFIKIYWLSCEEVSVGQKVGVMMSF